MKKHFGILIALLVAIGLVGISKDAHAMSAKDLSNKVYEVQVTFSYDENNPYVQAAEDDGDYMGDQHYYLFTGSKGKWVMSV